jgi:hypothetical protein
MVLELCFSPLSYMVSQKEQEGPHLSFPLCWRKRSDSREMGQREELERRPECVPRGLTALSYTKAKGVGLCKARIEQGLSL